MRQSIWCRKDGTAPKYFSLWKSKLAKTRTAVAAGAIPKGVSSRPLMVPVVVKSAAVADTVRRVTAVAGVQLAVNVTLPNGIALTE
ncbi:MAG: hypothetical protein M3N50_02165 [Pseudomonadota bacterium]|nr:hypothetical protein [Pseudomonadota bacterium]